MFQKTTIGRVIAITSIAAALTACNTGRTKVSTGYYEIKGTTAKQLDREIKRKGPKVSRRHAIAVTQLKLEPDVTFRGNQFACDVSKARMNIDAQIKLPKWINKSEGSKNLKRGWTFYANYAKKHEQTHVEIAKIYAKKTVEIIRNLPTHPNCKSLTKTIKKVLKKMAKAHNKAQLQFDADESKRLKRLFSEAKKKARRKKA